MAFQSTVLIHNLAPRELVSKADCGPRYGKGCESQPLCIFIFILIQSLVLC
jgi:hypothetical protein